MPQKILIVDDDPHIRQVVRFALEKAGYLILEAANGQEALTLFTESAPNLVVLDVLMPEMDGTEVCRRLRASSAVPILFLSSRDDEVDRIVRWIASWGWSWAGMTTSPSHLAPGSWWPGYAPFCAGRRQPLRRARNRSPAQPRRPGDPDGVPWAAASICLRF